MRNRLFGALAALTLVASLAACGSSSTASGGSTDTISIKVTGKTSDKGDFSVKKGDQVKLTITTDKDEQVHLHGYDIHFDCNAGVPLEHDFTADKTGQFEYELEATMDHLGNMTVNP